MVPEAAKPWIEGSKRSAKQWMRNVTPSLHKAQTLMRHLPEPIRAGLDQVAGLAPLPGLFLSSTARDLLEAMEENEVDQSLVIAHPPFASNEFVLEACSRDERLIPVVNIPKDTAKPSAKLKTLVKQGARALKIHPASDGDGPDCTRYLSLLKAATELGIPVIIHTGCIHSNLIYKNPESGSAELYAPWFKKFSEVKFVLAHMNFHKPDVAMDLALEYPNVFVDTSWQPTETIGEAVRRIGSERILFGTDWPLLGDNLSIGINRIKECVETELITQEDAFKILGGNAMKLLKLEPNAS